MDEATKQRLAEIHKTYIYKKRRESDNEFIPVFDYFQTPTGYPKTDDEVRENGFVIVELINNKPGPKPTSGQNSKFKRFTEKYFKGLFDFGIYLPGRNGSKILDWDYNKILLDKETFDNASKELQRFRMEKYLEFFLLLLATIQNYYALYLVEYEEKPEPESGKTKKSRKKETNEVGLFEVLSRFELSRIDPANCTSQYHDIRAIIFEYPRDSQRIASKNLTYSILRNLTEKYSEPPNGSWKVAVNNLIHFKSISDQKKKKTKQIAQALHSFITTETHLKCNPGAVTSQHALYLVEWFYEAVGVFLEGAKSVGGDKVKRIRNYVVAKKLNIQKDEVELEFNILPLKKHFPEWFVQFTFKFIDAEIYFIGQELIERFDLAEISTDIIFISQALCHAAQKPAFHHRVIPSANEPLKEVDAFLELFQIAKPLSQQEPLPKLGSVSFSVLGSEKKLDITQKIPLGIIQQALREYAENHAEDFCLDLIKVKHVFENEKDWIPNFIRQDEFNPPGNRFFPQFCFCFFQYLSEYSDFEANSKEKQNRFFEIIAVTIIKCLYKANHDSGLEQAIIKKVREWYHLAELGKQP